MGTVEDGLSVTFPPQKNDASFESGIRESGIREASGHPPPSDRVNLAWRGTVRDGKDPEEGERKCEAGGEEARCTGGRRSPLTNTLAFPPKYRPHQGPN